MARPHYEEGQKQAKEVLEETFWNMLETMPYEKITVRELTKQAGVNINTFYYHFENMENLVKEAINDFKIFDWIRSVFSLLGETHPEHLYDNFFSENNSEIQKGFNHISILTKSNSATVKTILCDSFFAAWKNIYSDNEINVSPKKEIHLQFAAGGFTNLFWGKDAGEIQEVLKDYVATPIPRALLKEIQS